VKSCCVDGLRRGRRFEQAVASSLQFHVVLVAYANNSGMKCGSRLSALLVHFLGGHIMAKDKQINSKRLPPECARRCWSDRCLTLHLATSGEGGTNSYRQHASASKLGAEDSGESKKRAKL